METDQTLAIERRLAGVEQELDSAKQALGAALKRNKPPRDEPYQCGGCHRILGWYHRAADELRVSHMGLVIRFKLGPGGIAQFTCPTCGAVEDLDTTTEFTGELQVRPGGGAVLDVAALKQLLAQAESNGGAITLRVQGHAPQDG